MNPSLTPGYRPLNRLHVVRDEPVRPPTPPADPLAYTDVPPEAKAAWAAMEGPLSRVRPTMVGSFALAGKLFTSADELDAIAIAALKAAAAIRSAPR